MIFIWFLQNVVEFVFLCIVQFILFFICAWMYICFYFRLSWNLIEQKAKEADKEFRELAQRARTDYMESLRRSKIIVGASKAFNGARPLSECKPAIPPKWVFVHVLMTFLFIGTQKVWSRLFLECSVFCTRQIKSMHHYIKLKICFLNFLIGF